MDEAGRHHALRRGKEAMTTPWRMYSALRGPGGRRAISIGPRQLARQLEIKRLSFEQIVEIQRGWQGRVLIRSGILQFIDWGLGHMDARFVAQREHLRRWRHNQYMETAFSCEVAGMIHEDPDNMR